MVVHREPIPRNKMLRLIRISKLHYKENEMKYKVIIWNDSIQDFQVWEYPYLETALMMANKLCHQYKGKVFISDGTTKGSCIVEP